MVYDCNHLGKVYTGTVRRVDTNHVLQGLLCLSHQHRPAHLQLPQRRGPHQLQRPQLHQLVQVYPRARSSVSALEWLSVY